MLVKLDGNISIIDPMRKVPMATTILTIVGWGGSDKGGVLTADIFQEADVTYFPNAVCTQIWD
jgi:hypothetical protein